VRNRVVGLLLLIVNLLALSPRTLRAAASPDYISGQVLLASSKPASALWVILYVGTTQRARSLTGDDGRYYIGGLPNGAYSLVVRKQINGANLFQGKVTLPQNKIYNVKIR